MVIYQKSFNLSTVKKSYNKYSLTTRSFICRYDAESGQFRYTLHAARKNSGSRGGGWRNPRCWVWFNLYPDQRAAVNTLPAE